MQLATIGKDEDNLRQSKVLLTDGAQPITISKKFSYFNSA
jgi:hypothetical protein